MAITDPLQFMKFDEMLSREDLEFHKRSRAICGDIKSHLDIFTLGEKAEFPEAVVQLVKRFGPAGMTIKGYGCPGWSTVQAMLFTMELARVDASIATFYLVHSGLAMASIEVAGTEVQKAKWLPPMSRMELTGAFGLTDSEAGSDATNLLTKAEKVDGGWKINGKKRWIGNATIADVVIIWAKVEGSGIQGFLVEPKRHKGVTISKIENKMSLRIVQNAEILLIDVIVEEDARMTGAKDFHSGTAQVLLSSRLKVAAIATGTLMNAYESTLKYVKQRKQFNRPIARFQLIQDRIVRTLGLLQACLLTMLHYGKVADAGALTMAQAALAKAYTTRCGREGVALCRESLGGNGIVTDFGVMLPFMDMEGIYTYEGTYDINALLVGRAVTGEKATV